MPLNLLFLSSITLLFTEIFLISILIIYGKGKIAKLYLLYNFAILLWGLVACGVIIIHMPKIADIFWRIGCFPVAFIPPLLLHITYTIINKKNTTLTTLAYIQSCIFTFLILTKNQLFYSLIPKLYYGLYYIPSPGPLYFVHYIIWLCIGGYAFFLLFKFYFSRPYNEKNTAKFIIISNLIGVPLGALNFLYYKEIPIFLLGNFGIAIYSCIFTYAIFHNKILGIDIIIRKSLIYSILIATLTSIYLLLIMLFEGLFRSLVGYKSLFISLSAAFIMALLFNPLRNKIQILIDKLFLGNTPHEIAHENELLKQELEKSERLKIASTLALGLAHEIKNPLTTLETFAEYLPQKYKDEDFINKFSRLVPGEVKRINNIIHQLLDFSKPSPPSFEQIRIFFLIKDTLDFLNNEFLKRKISIKENHQNPEVAIQIDPRQIKQVILNLLINAMEAMPNGGEIKIKTYLAENKSFIIAISDTGCGIAKEDLKHIFDPFYSKKESGTGLGLSITHQIIKNHNGKIEVGSKINQGTIFKIKLPITNI